jgi:hypothetical protein
LIRTSFGGKPIGWLSISRIWRSSGISPPNLHTPEDYKDIMVVLTEAGILPQEKLGKFKKMAQFRSVIVHDPVWTPPGKGPYLQFLQVSPARLHGNNSRNRTLRWHAQSISEDDCTRQ